MTFNGGEDSVSNDIERRAPINDETTRNYSADEVAVRGLYQQLMDGWNRGSGEDFAAVFTEDGDLVAFDGTHFKGREEIAPFHQQLFDRWLKGSRLVGRVKDVRFLSPDVAVMHAVGSTVMRGKSEPSPERDSIQTLVAVREGDGWRFAAFQNTRVRSIGPNVVAVVLWALTDLLWRIFRPNKRTTNE
ncbi:MAG: SgcJ/EcaC family oxidoreductase [Actinomycetota bacterium]|nr:SgcJ/EcaC family oxidoreductase [Actinomycetota bacterium]